MCHIVLYFVHESASGITTRVKDTIYQDRQLWLPLSSNKETFFVWRNASWDIESTF